MMVKGKDFRGFRLLSQARLFGFRRSLLDRFNRPVQKRGFGQITVLSEIYRILSAHHNRVFSGIIIMLTTASAVGVFGLVVATTMQKNTASVQQASFDLDHRVKPSFLHFGKLSKNQKTKIAGQIHFLSQQISKATRKNPSRTKDLASVIFTESYRAGVDPLLVSSVIQSESAFRHTARSNRSAFGLMQIQPPTAQFTARLIGEKWKGHSALLHDRHYNVRLGIAYLKYLKKRFNGDLDKALMAYNWGPTNMDNALKGRKRIPSSVKHYSKSIRKRHEVFHSSFTDSKEQYQFMNASYVPETLWSDLLTSG